MYLKRLELYGFKTFAERTELEFGPGITAIVGPNGSGKSNISDAILWVLGEQAMKSMRSAKSTDMIFNGSDTRKALGLAEVHLTLDNSSGRLPTDFTEVTVARRVFRSGESEYMLNRTPVRLRDVQDLFMDTGIGKQSYSIINQGEVDAILSSRSEDRRELFEEAAGITKYKHRKREALRKLEQTRLNLLRVNDIISELESQLGPLAEQSETARQFQVINAELTRLQLSLIVTQYLGLQNSQTRARERETELQRELEGLRHALQQTDIKETTLRAELERLEEELEDRRGVEHRISTAVQTAEGQLALLQQQEENTRQELERLRQERIDLEGQSGQFDTEIAAAEAAQLQLQQQIAGIEAEITATNEALQQASGTVNALAQQIQQRRGAYLEFLDQSARARNELTGVESLLRTSEGRLSRIAGEQAELTAQLAERRQMRDRTTSTLAERQAFRDALQTQRGDANRARLRAVEALNAARHEEQQAREQLAGMRARQHALHELEESLEGYFPGVRAVIGAAKAGTLRGQYAPVSELLDVPANLETAIEVALGASLQDVVTDTEQSARQAIALLKQSQAGRATFLPLDLLSPAPRALFATAPGVLGNAMELVSYDARYEKIAQHLLGRVLIVRELDDALALARAGSSSNWNRIVTLDGEVVHPARAITGGSQGKSGGLLKRKRELQELTEQVVRSEEAVQAQQRRVQDATADVQRFDAELARLAKESEQAAAAIAEAERALATVQRDIAAIDERTVTLTEESAWINREIETARAEETRHRATLDTLEASQREAEAAVAESERALAGSQSERDTMTEQFATQRLRLSEAQGAVRAQQATVKRIMELRDNLAGRLTQNTADAERLQTRLTTLDTSRQEAAAELQRYRQAYAQSSGELDTTKERRAALLETIAANLDAQKAGREAIEDCQGRLHRSELRTTQIDTELGFLEGQFFEDYRLTPDQAVAQATPVENRGIAVARLRELQEAVAALGTVNLGAIEEFDRVRERLTFLTTQRHDLEEGRDSLCQVIGEIDLTCKEKFLEAFAAIGREFQDLFVRLFGGGKTDLSLIDPSDVLESGIDINVTIPGKRNQNLLQLSGGERALTALALLFAMLRVKPSPFVVLDEIDAPLDEANIGRYCEVLRDFTANTQFLIVTHNKNTMEAADVLYGVTMEKAGISKIVSVRLTEVHS